MKLTTKLAIILGASLAAAAAAHADQFQIKAGIYVSGAGGNYTADPIGGFESVLANYVNGKSTNGTVFGTFCLEMGEYFKPGFTYDVQLKTRAVNGGTDNHENPDFAGDPISKGTAFLYQKFATGALGAFSGATAASFQDLIWFLEDEKTSLAISTWTPAWTGMLMQTFGSVENAKTDNAPGGYGVMVMNLSLPAGKDDGLNGYQGIRDGRRQDHLVYVPDGGMTIVLLGIGLVGLAVIRRRT